MSVGCLRDFCVLNRLWGKRDDLARASLLTWLPVCYFLTKREGERKESKRYFPSYEQMEFILHFPKKVEEIGISVKNEYCKRHSK